MPIAVFLGLYRSQELLESVLASHGDDVAAAKGGLGRMGLLDPARQSRLGSAASAETALEPAASHGPKSVAAVGRQVAGAAEQHNGRGAGPHDTSRFENGEYDAGDYGTGEASYAGQLEGGYGGGYGSLRPLGPLRALATLGIDMEGSRFSDEVRGRLGADTHTCIHRHADTRTHTGTRRHADMRTQAHVSGNAVACGLGSA